MASEAQNRAIKKYFQTPKGKRKLREASWRYRRHIKQEVLKHYGNEKIACVRCGEESIECLTIDHIKAIGAKAHQESGLGVLFYLWLRRNNYPEGYQTLCMNCQWKKKATEREYRGCL